MDRVQKETFVADLQTSLEGVELMVVSHYSGLSVTEMTNLRRNMSAEGGEVRVAKNRLAKLAVAKTPYSVVTEFLNGPTALSFSKDPVAAAKVTQKFADDNEKLVILGGAMGEKLLSAADIKALSKLPSLDELRGKLVGIFQAPAQQLAAIAAAPAGQLARVVALKPENA